MLGSVGRATDETDKNPYFQETYSSTCVWVERKTVNRGMNETLAESDQGNDVRNTGGVTRSD